MVAAAKVLNLMLAFLLELGLLAALVVWGLAVGGPVGVTAAVLGPAAVATVWALWLAPRSPRRLGGGRLVAAKALLFGLGAAALLAAGWPAWSLAFALAAAVNLALASLWRQEQVA